MSDLISRSELIDFLITENQRCITSTGHELTMNMILSFIENQPKAYDVDKVVAELDKKAERRGGEDYFVEFGDAIEIVKQGGVSYDCNNCANYTEPDEIDRGCYLCCKGYENNYKPKADNGGASDDVCEWKMDGDMAINPHNLSKYKIKQYDGLYALDTCQHCRKKIKVVK